MRGLNKVTLIGQLGKDPDIRVLENGVHVAKFSIATTETFKDKNGERKEQTEWHNIVLWRGLAEIAQKFLHKGNQVFVEGKLQTRNWEVEGVRKNITEIVGDNIILLERKQNGDRDIQTDINTSTDTFSNIPSSFDDLPF
jgi:single-strand DNA-binding protein